MEIAIDIGNGDAMNVFNTIQKLADEEKQNGLRQFLPTIYRVPSIIRDLKSCDFSPRVLSIGPLHRKEMDFQVSEEQKVACMNKLFCRLNSPPEETMKECVWMVHSNVGKIKAHYAAGWITYDGEDFAKMMVIDGCFILELIYQSWSSVIWSSLKTRSPSLFFNTSFDLTIYKLEITCSLPVLLLEFLQDIRPFDRYLSTKNIGENHPHILGLLRNCSCSSDAMSSKKSKMTSYNAVELSRYGANFKSKESAQDPLSMKFKATFWFPGFSWLLHEPSLRMPKLIIQDHTESVLRNLITYEQYSHKIQDCITSFAFSMDKLVNTKEDVDQLVESQVVVNHLGSHEEAANMINSLCKGVVLHEVSCDSQCTWDELHRYCNQFWPKHIAWLRSNYFSSPWSIIALLAGFVLFALTAVQTHYAIHTA